MRILVVNAGSSSLKLRVVEPDDTVSGQRDLRRGDGTGVGGQAAADAISAFVSDCGPLDAVGHRVVHGGPEHTGPVVVDDDVFASLDALSTLAPLHNPPALEAMAATGRALPGVPAVACFDTAFHAGLPPAASTYALPASWNERWHLRRYGFHGLSCAWALRRSAEMTGGDPGRLVVCHLGAGASVTAVAGGRSVDTTMGFTPVEGLVMATRPGDVDPGLLTWLLGQGVAVSEVTATLEHGSGLAGLSGVPGGDMAGVLRRRDAGDPAATLAVAVFVHRLRAKIAAMAAAAGGLDTLVFTGGIGEHGAAIRREACTSMAWMGLAVDEGANAGARPDASIEAAGSAARCLVIESREDLAVAEECRRLLTRR